MCYRMTADLKLLLLTISILYGPLNCYGFKICAFNIQSFGDSKSGDPKIMNSVSRIVARCDICLLQEVRDQKNKAIPRLIAALNGLSRDGEYDYVASGRLGRTQTYQEQYVFVYRKSTAKLKNQYQYPDTQKGDMDAFSREPFVVHFEAPKTVAKEFVLIPQHTTPSNATKEIDELYDVFMDISERWKIKNVMFLGDFNAACGYVAKKNWKNIRLFSDTSFIWLIKDHVDTTVKHSTDCAYDRIVVHGEPFLRAIEPFSAQPFNFAKEFHLTEAQALEVSDHYPIEVKLKKTRESRIFTRSNKASHLLPTAFVLNIVLLFLII
ncbi:deoxyribonuclease gamma-like isoform X2 [Myxocyprinus asiaticus]|uniref:deoxyribonuclease gamma-like isoform X2 n=1 Tax=Myxocyprinus asiaticus TaxID=70543 RepID=UPI002221FAC6|nr:deoxyribonuclease gamma-like isoform X2 [Myxocyprinus asiaticus]